MHNGEKLLVSSHYGKLGTSQVRSSIVLGSFAEQSLHVTLRRYAPFAARELNR